LKQAGYEDGVKNVHLQEAMKGVKMSRDVHNLLVARDAGKAVAEADAKITGLDPLRVESRHYLHHLLDNGAQYLPDKLVQYEHHGIQKLGQLDKAQGTSDR